MSKSSKLTAVLAAASVAIPAGAWRVDLPQPTEVLASSLVLEGWSPKPTSPPELRRMLRRQSNDDDEDDDESMLVAPDATCGYISGLEGAHYTCVGDFSCVMYTASSTSSGNVACCNDRNCNLRVTCINYEEFYSSSACNDACRVDGFTVKCIDSDMPYCNTISFSDNIYDYWCNNVEINTAQEAFTTYDGQEDHEFRTIPVSELRTTLTTTDDEETSNAPGPTVSSVPTSETTATDGSEETGNSDNNNDDNSNDDGGSDTPVGAIVGGVVGGVGAIGIAGLAFWFFLRRKKNKNAGDGGNQASPGTAYAPVDQGGAPPQGQYDMSQQQQFNNGTNSYYDPKFVAAGAVPYQQQQQYGQYPPQQQFSSVTGTHVPSSNSPPMSHTSPSPANTYNQPNYQQPGFMQQNAPVIHEAPSNPSETNRAAHELA